MVGCGPSGVDRGQGKAGSLDRLAGASTSALSVLQDQHFHCACQLAQHATQPPQPQHCVSTQLNHPLATVCRLQDMVLRWLPVTHNKAVDAEAAAAALGDSPIKSVLRSKGFMWLSNKHATAFYWSHAGGGRSRQGRATQGQPAVCAKPAQCWLPQCCSVCLLSCCAAAGQHFEIREEGDWWAAVPDEEWPDEASGQRDIILSDFAPGVGDRRQEIVFIGAGMDEVRAGCGWHVRMLRVPCTPQPSRFNCHQ